MKKNYIAPSMEITNVEFQQMIAESNTGIQSNNGIKFGGWDDGTNEAGSRSHGNLWDDEDDF